MSAENIINDYLSDDSTATLTLESLQVYVQEGVSIGPLVGLIDFLRQIKSMTSIDNLFSIKKNTIRMAAVKAARAVDDDIFSDDGGSNKNDSPVDEPAPTTEAQAEGYLKRMFLYFKKIIKGLSFPEMKTIYTTAKSVIIKLLAGVGIVGMGVVIPLTIPLSLMIVVICIMNAVEQTEDIEDESSRINLKQAFNTVMSSFKKMFTTLKVGKGEGKFAVISSIIVGIMGWMKWKFINTDKARNVIASKMTIAKKIISTFGGGPMKLLDNLEQIENAVVKGVVSSAKGAIKTVMDMLPGISQASILALLEKKRHAYDKAIASGKTPAEAREISRKVVSGIIKQVRDAKTTAGQSGATSKVIYWGVTVIAIATILYLFANLVDSFNLRRVKEREDDSEEFERTV